MEDTNTNVRNKNPRWTIRRCHVVEFEKPSVISTGIGFLDHMIDQFYSHAQIGISIHVVTADDDRSDTDKSIDLKIESIAYINRHASSNTATYSQTELLETVGAAIGTALRPFIAAKASGSHDTPQQQQQLLQQTSTFGCPLDEALTICFIQRCDSTTEQDTVESGKLLAYTLPPYGIYPTSIGRTHIGALQTNAIEPFWKQLALSSGLIISLAKLRGMNGHHIVESSFKAFARALRNLIDNIDTTGIANQNNSNNALVKMYGTNSMNYQASIDLHRHALIERNTKETSIRTELHLDGGNKGVHINTGICKLNEFLNVMASNANMSLNVNCKGDLYIDEHHTAEDVAISIGQALNDSLGDKAGLNRMWSSSRKIHAENCIHKVHVIMDLSNRPCLTHNLDSVFGHVEMVDDLSCEMFEHVLESIVVNGRMTVHIIVEKVEDCETVVSDSIGKDRLVDKVFTAIAHEFGHVMKYCSMVDSRRAGTTASSKGTLSV